MRDRPAFGSPQSFVDACTKVTGLDRCGLQVSKGRAHEVLENDKIEQPA